MPIVMDPDATFDVVLDSDADQPQAQRPTFVFRQMTCRQQRQVVALADSAQDAGGLAILDKTLEALNVSLSGWRNMPFDYDPDRLDELITLTEAAELLNKATMGQSVEADDAKK